MKSNVTQGMDGRSIARVAASIFAGLCVANGFFWWSFPAWFSLWGAPDGLVNPAFDKWIISPLAVAVYVLQYPSYWIAERSRWWANGPTVPLVMLTSLVSTGMYTSTIVAASRWRQRRAARRAA